MPVLCTHEDSVLERERYAGEQGDEGLRLYESVLTQAVHPEQVTFSGFSFPLCKKGWTDADVSGMLWRFGLRCGKHMVGAWCMEVAVLEGSGPRAAIHRGFAPT